MSAIRKHPHWLAFGLAAWACAAPAQTRPDGEVTERFKGTLRVGGQAVPVRLQTYLIPNGERRSWPASDAALLVELRAGTLMATGTGAQAVRRRSGEFWIVAPGMRLTVETGDDSAVISLTTLGRP